MPIDSVNDRVDYIVELVRRRIMGAVRDVLYEVDATEHETLGVQHRFHCSDIVTPAITEGVEIHQSYLEVGGPVSIEND